MVIRLMAAVLTVVAAYYVWDAFQSRALPWLALPAVLLFVAIGLASQRKWGAVVWYVFAAGASSWWVISVAKLAWSGWPYSDSLQSAISVIPGVFLVSFCVLGSIVVRRSFRS